jgi:hypothetical protein
MRYHYLSPRMTIATKILKKTRVWRKQNSCTILVGMQSDKVTMENNREVIKKNLKEDLMI